MKNYPYLPEGREILYVPITDKFMALAKETALTKSTDSVQPTGSVVVKDGQVIGYATNRSPLGHIKFLYNLHKKGWCLRRLLKIKSGTKYWLCVGCAKHRDHSEQSAVRDAQKNDHDTNGADLYLWGHWWCCKSCWDKIISGGIRNVYLLDTSEQDFKR